jgi:hypothetical protein
MSDGEKERKKREKKDRTRVTTSSLA